MHNNITSPGNSPIPDSGSVNSSTNPDTIVAIATAPGRGGIGIVRISGKLTAETAKAISGCMPEARKAISSSFFDQDGEIIDTGILLYFPSPRSYTGEDVLEIHGHGSPVALQLLIRRCIELGCRMARPGEFSERAFLNGKLDLAQAEAVADLIESNTEAAARSAIKSLQGAFSARVNELAVAVARLRIFVEAAIDFPDEEIDFLEHENVVEQLEELSTLFSDLRESIHRGKLIRDGIKVVLTGRPNAGKSSLLNALAEEERAIVSDIPGTTRDVLEKVIAIDGLQLTIVDTAGIRDADNSIEIEGVRRAQMAQQSADMVLMVVDDSDSTEVNRAIAKDVTNRNIVTLTVRNKIDLTGRKCGDVDEEVSVSALTGQGIDRLKEKIKGLAGFRSLEETDFIARERHLDALNRAEQFLKNGLAQQLEHKAGELLAEDLVSCHKALGEITGEVSSDDLLGMIFSSFCIGK